MMTRLSRCGYNGVAAQGRAGKGYGARDGFSQCRPGSSDRAKVVRSNLSPTEEYIAPAYAGGWVPRALPRIYLVGTMRAVAPGGADFLPRGRKTRGLLACLCLAQG